QYGRPLRKIKAHSSRTRLAGGCVANRRRNSLPPSSWQYARLTCYHTCFAAERLSSSARERVRLVSPGHRVGLHRRAVRDRPEFGRLSSHPSRVEADPLARGGRGSLRAERRSRPSAAHPSNRASHSALNPTCDAEWLIS